MVKVTPNPPVDSGSPALWKSPRGDPNLYPAASFAITSNPELFWWTQRLGSVPEISVD